MDAYIFKWMQNFSIIIEKTWWHNFYNANLNFYSQTYNNLV